MKKILLFLTLLFTLDLRAQFLPRNPDNLSQSLAKILKDYPGHFKDLKGKLLAVNIESTDYRCTTALPGSLSSVITLHGAEQDHDYTWEAVMDTLEDFKKARSEFGRLFREIRKTTFFINAEKISLSADYVPPSGDLQFSSIIFRPVPSNDSLHHAVVDLSLQYQVTEWQLTISIYDKEDYGTGPGETGQE